MWVCCCAGAQTLGERRDSSLGFASDFCVLCKQACVRALLSLGYPREQDPSLTHDSTARVLLS